MLGPRANPTSSPSPAAQNQTTPSVSDRWKICKQIKHKWGKPTTYASCNQTHCSTRPQHCCQTLAKAENLAQRQPRTCSTLKIENFKKRYKHHQSLYIGGGPSGYSNSNFLRNALKTGANGLLYTQNITNWQYLTDRVIVAAQRLCAFAGLSESSYLDLT